MIQCQSIYWVSISKIHCQYIFWNENWKSKIESVWTYIWHIDLLIYKIQSEIVC
jgi:hypothetical protein